MERRRKRIQLPVAIASVLILVGCTTPNYRSFYYLDLRSYPVPVMVNQVSDSEEGRRFLAVVSSESTVSQSTYYTYDYSVTTTTSTSKETTQSLDNQLLMRAAEGDSLIRIRGISFFTHVMAMPAYSENYQDMSVEVSYHRTTGAQE